MTGRSIYLSWLLPTCIALATLPVFAEDRVFPMHEVSVFEVFEKYPETAANVLSSEYAICDSKRRSEVKKYPELKSKHPLYGTITLGGDPFGNRAAALVVHFVLDQTQPQAPTPPKPQRTLLKKFIDDWFVDDGDDVEMVQFDRLYFDANRDLDLTNDPVLMRLKKHPWESYSREEQDISEWQAFECAKMEFDGGPGVGIQSCQLLLTLMDATTEDGYLEYRSPIARKGDIQIGDRKFTAVLAQSEPITGRFDGPYVGLSLLSEKGPPKSPMWWGGDWLSAAREFDGQLYMFRATPSGDQLTVQTYDGEYGTLRVLANGNDDKKVGATGALMSRDGHLLYVGSAASWFSSVKEQNKRLPVGDYSPLMLTLGFDGAEIDLSPNTYDEQGGDIDAKDRQFRIEIRKDKPYIIDFSEKPQVTVIKPRPGETIKAGQKVYIEAVLVDRNLGLMIDDIMDTRNGEEVSTEDDDGKPLTITTYPSLNPMVSITDADGRQIVAGSMPFG